VWGDGAEATGTVKSIGPRGPKDLQEAIFGLQRLLPNPQRGITQQPPGVCTTTNGTLKRIEKNLKAQELFSSNLPHIG
jgi:hypothetical protein